MSLMLPEREEWVDLVQAREEFEQNKRIYESVKLTFRGVEGYDVYNPSIPFTWKGKRYIYGRVERPDDWARSWVGLFESTGRDEWTLSNGSMHAHHGQLEDPYVAIIDGLFVLGGSHIQYEVGEVKTYFGYFYRGMDLDDLAYFTTGPDCMKDIRLVQLGNGRIGVFSRPRGPHVLAQFGTESVIGFTIVDGLDGLTAEAIGNARVIVGLFAEGEWGGCNQAYRLDDGLIGMIGHQCCYREEGDLTLSVYTNVAYLFDPVRHEVIERKIIATRDCYPEGRPKLARLADCAFTSGIVKRPDGRCDLYSGLGDSEAGRVVIDDPFDGHGYSGVLAG